VIAILGILMAIAIPAYQDYTVRAKVSEGMNLAGSAKLAVAETRQTNGSWPNGNSGAGIPAAVSINGNNVTSVTVGAGTGLISIAYTGDSNLNNQDIILSPSWTGGAITWSCTQGSVLPRFRPANCR
jgi:type IV pilus assembly protein PilA